MAFYRLKKQQMVADVVMNAYNSSTLGGKQLIKTLSQKEERKREREKKGKRKKKRKKEEGGRRMRERRERVRGRRKD